MLQDNYGLTI
jgi:CheY-like chemotaxis protein